MKVTCDCGEDVTKALETANKNEQDFAICPGCKSRVYGIVAIVKPKDNITGRAIKEVSRNGFYLVLVLSVLAICNILSRWLPVWWNGLWK